MPKLRRSCPSYALHKPSGQARVQLGGRTYYLGPHGSPESREAYDRLLAEWLVAGRRPPIRKAAPANPGAADGLTVDELIVRYLEFARGYYVKRGRPTSEIRNIKDALRPLQALYGSTPAAAFGPKSFKAVRAKMVSDGLARSLINQRAGKIVRAFKWAGSEELVPVSVYQSLKTVDGLRAGRSEAKEAEPVSPVPEAFVDAIRPHVSAQVWAMIRLQSLTGMRPNEVVAMRSGDLDATGPVWVYRPREHKMEHAGRDRLIHLGPQSQAVLRPWLRPNLGECLFQPAEAEAARKAEMRARRKSKVQPSQVNRSKRGARRKPSDRYTVNTYRNAIYRACDAADVPRWSPGRLRHNAATRLRREFGLEAAQVVLGHASADVTQIYAEVDHQRAAEVMARIG